MFQKQLLDSLGRNCGQTATRFVPGTALPDSDCLRSLIDAPGETKWGQFQSIARSCEKLNLSPFPVYVAFIIAGAEGNLAEKGAGIIRQYVPKHGATPESQNLPLY